MTKMRMEPRRWYGKTPISIASSGLAAILLLASCGSDTSASEEQAQVSVGASQFAGFATVLSLEDSEDYEVDVEVVEFGNSADRGVALASGQIDMALLGWTQVVELSEDPATELVVLASNFEEGRTIIAGDGTGINSLEDLKGKTVAYSVGSMVDLDLNSQLQALDMSIDDVDAVNMSFTDMPIALANGDVDAYYGSEPQSSSSLAAGSGSLLQYPYDEPNAVPYGSLNGALVTTQSYLEDNPEAVETFLNAYVEETERLNSDPEALTEEISEITGEDQEVLEHTLNNLQLTYSLDGYEEKVGELIQTMLDMGFIETAPEYGDFVDASYIEAATE